MGAACRRMALTGQENRPLSDGRFSVFQGKRASPKSSDPINSCQQPAELSADDRGITVGADAGDVDVDRSAAVGTTLRGDGPRLSGDQGRRSLEDPVFGPVPGNRVAADHCAGAVEIVIG